MKCWKKILYVLCLFSFPVMAEAQTVKQIEVSADHPYVDHVTLMPGSSDRDLLVKIAFDEPNNSLTVSLISYRKLFVFQADVRYSQAVRCRKLHPEKLPYVVASDEQASYLLSKSLKRSLQNGKKHIFKRWIEYKGLQPQPTDYKMVNDYIEQRFDVLYKEANVSITLRDVLLMEGPLTRKKHPVYELFSLTDLDRTYEIAIQRDPCYGKEEALQAAAAQVESIKAGYEAFDQRFGRSLLLGTSDLKQLFNKMKSMLLEQFPRKNETSECPDIQAYIDQYNQYVDSIQSVQGRFRSTARSGAPTTTLGLSGDYILTTARRIDNNVNRWLLSSDKIERRDLETACRQLIDQVRGHLQGATEVSASQREALRVFYEAENYFRRTCVNK